MSYSCLSVSHLSFSYDSAINNLIDDLTLDIHAGWTGVTGANGTGKTTFLLLSCGLLKPRSGTVSAPPGTFYIPQRTDDPPEDFLDFLSDPDAAVGRLISVLGIGFDWPYRWDSLSHGERKRAQIGTGLWKQPGLLALDEPTNHLDAEAKRYILNALRDFRGIGLIVSHDRLLMDELCSRCLFARPEDWKLRPGGISKGLAEEQRGLALKDHDARFKKNLARITGKDGCGGKLLRQLDGRIAQASLKYEALAPSKKQQLGVSIRTSRAGSDFLFHCGRFKAELGDGRTISAEELSIRPAQRIAVCGPNGSGKTTLLRAVIADLSIDAGEYLYLAKEISADESRELLQALHSLETDVRGTVLSHVSRLGSDPERLLGSVVPSPGETRKLLLAMGFCREPKLLILDEPTNHLDLPSIQCLEEALVPLDCAFLMVSHDEAFLERLEPELWDISGGQIRVII